MTAAIVRLRFLVLAIAAILIGAACTIIPNSSVDALPEFTPTYVEVQTEALGLSATEVEQMVTVPLEADLLNGVQDVEVIRSESLTGLSRIVMIFKAGINDYVARARVQEKLTQSAALPQVSKPPTMLQPLSTESRLLMFTMEPQTVSAIETSVLARWTVRPRLMGIPGVANVAIWGNRDRQLQVQVNPDRLKAKKITLTQIVESVGNAQIVSPLTFLEASTPGTGGFIETPQQRLQVRHVFDKLATPDQMGKIPIVEARNVQVKDVATVVESHQPLIGDAVTGRPGSLLVVVEKFPGANTIEVTKAVEAALVEMRPGLTGVEIGTEYFRASDYVGGGLTNLVVAVLVGLGLLVAAAGLWFRDWRVSVLILASVATGLSVASLIVHFSGHHLNLLSLSGVAAGAVLLALDAIAAYRTPDDDLVGSLAPSRGTLGFVTLIGLLSVAPLAVLQGRPGALLSSVPLSFGVATLAAWLVGLLVVAPVASLIGTPRSAPAHSGLAIRAPRLTGTTALVALAALTLIAGLCLGLAPRQLAPSFNGRDVIVSLEAQPGTSLPLMSKSVGDTVAKLRAIEGVQAASAHVGRAVTGDQIVDVNSAEIWVRMAEDVDRARAVRAVTDVSTSVPGVTASVNSFGGTRLESVGALFGGEPSDTGSLDMVTGTTHPLVVRVYGENQQVLVAKAKEVQQALTGVNGVVNPSVVLPAEQDGIEITVDLERAKKYGIKPGDLRRAEAILVQGIQVGSVFEGQKVFDVIVLGDKSTRASVEALKNLWIDAPSGGHVKLSDVADVRTAKVPVVIKRDAVARYLDVVADVNGDLAGTAAAAKDAVAKVGFPLEHHAEVLTSTTAQEMGLGSALLIGAGALIGMFLLIQAAAASWRGGLAGTLASLSALAGGGVVALFTGVTIGTVLGALTLLAIGARHSLWTLHRPGGELSGAVPNRPAAGTIVGASLGVAALVLPAAVMAGRPGLEILGVFAWTVLGGLVTATLAALLLSITVAAAEEVA